MLTLGHVFNMVIAVNRSDGNRRHRKLNLFKTVTSIMLHTSIDKKIYIQKCQIYRRNNSLLLTNDSHYCIGTIISK